MSKESLQAGLGQRYHKMYIGDQAREKNDEDVEVRPRTFEAEYADEQRLLPRLRERQRRL